MEVLRIPPDHAMLSATQQCHLAIIDLTGKKLQKDMCLVLVRTETSRRNHRLADQKKAILFQGSPFQKGISRLGSTLESKSGVEVNLPIGTAVAAAESPESAKSAAGHRQRAAEVR